MKNTFIKMDYQPSLNSHSTISNDIPNSHFTITNDIPNSHFTITNAIPNSHFTITNVIKNVNDETSESLRRLIPPNMTTIRTGTYQLSHLPDFQPPKIVLQAENGKTRTTGSSFFGNLKPYFSLYSR